MSNQKKFLIGQLCCFGDCLYATTIAKQIKNDYPNSHVTWAVAKKYQSILENNPHIDKLWVIDTLDFYGQGWNDFVREAEQKKVNGEFDELIFSQILGKNILRWSGTIRATTLKAYHKKITVDVSPVLRLTDTEIKNVKNFAEINNLKKFKNVVLFECSPGSGQSEMNFETAFEISKSITSKNQDICFILSSLNDIPEANSQIISAKSLSYRENAELTKYCNLLIGCSSGITWLSTAESAKKLPTIQILNEKYHFFAGVNYDAKIWNLDQSKSIEILSPSKEKIINVVESFFIKGLKETKIQYHQDYRPTLLSYKDICNKLIFENKERIRNLIPFSLKFYLNNRHLNLKDILLYPIKTRRNFYK